MSTRARRVLRRAERADALVSFALAVPMLAVTLIGLLGISLVVQVQLGLVAVAQDAARAASLAATPDQAVREGVARGQLVGAGYPLGNGSLRISIDASQWRPGGSVRATARYQVGGQDVPMLGPTTLPLERAHAEPIATYRSFGVAR